MKKSSNKRRTWYKIYKAVGINGIIAIKNDMKRSGSASFYKSIQTDNIDFTSQNLIFCHLTMVKDFAQHN